MRILAGKEQCVSYFTPKRGLTIALRYRLKRRVNCRKTFSINLRSQKRRHRKGQSRGVPDGAFEFCTCKSTPAKVGDLTVRYRGYRKSVFSHRQVTAWKRRPHAKTILLTEKEEIFDSQSYLSHPLNTTAVFFTVPLVSQTWKKEKCAKLFHPFKTDVQSPSRCAIV